MLSPDETSHYLDAIDDAREALRQYKLKRHLALAGTIAAGIWILTVAILGAMSVALGWFGHADMGGAIAGLEMLGVFSLGGGIAALASITQQKKHEKLRKAIRSAEREFQRKAL